MEEKLYSEKDILELLETLRIKLGLYGLYDDKSPKKWMDNYLIKK